MTTLRARLADELNFLLTNRLPRRAATRAMAWYAGLRSPALTRLSLAAWRLFCDVELDDARETRFASLRDCFTRALRDGARPVDARPDVVVSPSDGIVGACGRLRGTRAWQVKGRAYSLEELLGPAVNLARYRDGRYVTLRLTAGMYHRFHSPDTGRIERVHFHPGDTWNVNPPALARVPRLYCRNERAVIQLRLATGEPLLLVPVAAILVASLRLHCLDANLDAHWRGPRRFTLRRPVSRGEELGWFEHGSTILVIAPPEFALAERVVPGARVRMGEALLLRR